jgi:hypothetical protein
MEDLGDVAHVESCFGLFHDGVSVRGRQVQCLCQMYHRVRKSCWTHPVELQVDEAQVEAQFGLFGDGANLDTR